MAAVLLALVCSNATAQPRLVKDTDVKPCRFIGRVSADSGYGKNYDWRGVAKYAALKRAEKLGASDIVVERYMPVGVFNGEVEARAYLCGGSPVKTAEAGMPSEAQRRISAASKLAAPPAGTETLLGSVGPIEAGLRYEVATKDWVSS